MVSSTRAIIEATRSVLYETNSEHIITSILKESQRLLGAEAASLFLVNPKRKLLEMAAATNLDKKTIQRIAFPLGVGVSGWVAVEGRTANIENIATDERYYQGVDQKTSFKTRGYLCVPLRVNDKILGTVQVLNRTSGGRFTLEDQELLEGFAVIAALALYKNDMHRMALEKRRMDSEMQIAKAFQQSLLPDTFDAPAPWSIAGFNKPARSMGGDMYDGFTTQNGYGIVLGDVSGKGPGAALWMSACANLIRYVMERGRDPIDHLPHIDRYLQQTMPDSSFITLFLGELSGNQLRFTSAGHNPMLLLSREGDVRWLNATGLPLGMMADMERSTETVDFPEGSVLVLFSDGVTEAENSKGLMYEEDRLLTIVQKNRELAPGELIDRIVRSVYAFSSGVEQSDDITLVVVRRHGA